MLNYTLIMDRETNETTGPQDLSALLAGVPPEVVALLGEQAVADIEQTARVAEELLAVAALPDPFEQNPGMDFRVLTPEVEAAVSEVNRAQDIENWSSQEIIQVAKAHAPVLRDASRHKLKEVRETFEKCRQLVVDETKDPVFDLAGRDPKLILSVAPKLYEVMQSAAQALPDNETIQALKQVLDAEDDIARLHGRTVMLQKKPELSEEINAARSRALRIRKRARPLSNKTIEAYTKRENDIATQGLKRIGVRRVHRSATAIIDDILVVEKIEERLGSLRGISSELHAELVRITRNAASGPAYELYQQLVTLKTERLNPETLRRELEARGEEVITGTASAEMYIAQKAELAEKCLRQSGSRFTAIGRRQLHDLKDTRITREIERRENANAEGRENPYRDIEPDKAFRGLCRDARDILAGGARLDYPIAKQLADALHRASFGSDGRTALEPHESGMIIGILAGRVESLVAAAARFDRATSQMDEQVEKLRLELPEQYKVIAEFNLLDALDKLKTLLDDAYDEQTLSALLPDAEAMKTVSNTVNSLWRAAHGLEPEPEETTEEPPEEESPTHEPDSQTEDDEDELSVIDEEMANLAEQLEWVVFPPGVTVSEIRRNLGENNVNVSRVNWDRIKHLLFLSDNFDGRIYRSYDAKLGTRVPYLVAEFILYGRRFAVAECPEIGNATYVVNDDLSAGTWEEVMRLSRQEARSLGARRIIHPKEDGHLTKIINKINSMLTAKVS